MEQVSGLDAAFLYCETPAMHLHVCGLLLLDPSTLPGGYSYERIRATARNAFRILPPCAGSWRTCRSISAGPFGSMTRISISTATSIGRHSTRQETNALSQAWWGRSRVRRCHATNLCGKCG